MWKEKRFGRNASPLRHVLLFDNLLQFPRMCGTPHNVLQTWTQDSVPVVAEKHIVRNTGPHDSRMGRLQGATVETESKRGSAGHLDSMTNYLIPVCVGHNKGWIFHALLSRFKSGDGCFRSTLFLFQRGFPCWKKFRFDSVTRHCLVSWRTFCPTTQNGMKRMDLSGSIRIRIA